VEVAAYTCRENLDHIQLFKGCGEKFLDYVSVLLGEVQFAPEEWIYRTGEVANEMYLVASGTVDELGEKDKRTGQEIVNRTIKSEHCFGELSFFFGMRHLVSAKAGKQSGAICFKLPRAQFLPLLKLFPEEEEILAEASLSSYDDSMSVSNHSKKSSSRHSVVSGRSGKSSRSSRSGRSKKSTAKSGRTAQSSVQISENTADTGVENDSTDSESDNDRFVGDEMDARIDQLKQRRSNDRTNMILSAAARGDLASLKLALKNANVNVCDTLKRTPLHIAASEGQLEVVNYMISCKADLNAEDQFKNTCLNDAIRHG